MHTLRREAPPCLYLGEASAGTAAARTLLWIAAYFTAAPHLRSTCRIFLDVAIVSTGKMPGQRSFIKADEEYKLLPESEPPYDVEQADPSTRVEATTGSGDHTRLLKIGLAVQTLVILGLLAIVYRSTHPQEIGRAHV